MMMSIGMMRVTWLDEPLYDSPFDLEGTYHGRVVAQTSTLPCKTVDSINMPPGITKDSGFVDATNTLFTTNVDDIIDWCVYYA